MTERTEAINTTNLWLAKHGLAKRLIAIGGNFFDSSNSWRIKVVKRLNRKSVVGLVEIDFETGFVKNVPVSIQTLVK